MYRWSFNLVRVLFPRETDGYVMALLVGYCLSISNKRGTVITDIPDYNKPECIVYELRRHHRNQIVRVYMFIASINNSRIFFILFRINVMISPKRYYFVLIELCKRFSVFVNIIRFAIWIRHYKRMLRNNPGF